MNNRLIAYAIVLATWLTGCQSDRDVELPSYFPSILHPADNTPTEARITLGRYLFYEPRLSIDSSLSCASCHLQSLAFTDGRKLSGGVHGITGFRNSPTLTNVAFQPYFFFDGGIPTLEKQVMAPLDNPDEMQLNIHQAALRLREDSFYTELFQKAYQRPPDAYSIVRALAAFQRTLLSYRAPIDAFWQGDTLALSPSQRKGLALFLSNRLGCATCHNGPNFTNYEFRHNGLPVADDDPGRRRVTTLPQDDGKFKVPTLRNITVTGPYMHDGSIASLDEVLTHYASGGVDHINKDKTISGFSLSATERADLLHFFEALTDTAFLRNPAFSSPFLE